jgi:hypothetical protein
MVSRNLLGGGIGGLAVTFLVILLVSSFLRPYRREGFAGSSCPPGKSRKLSCPEPGACC